MSTGFAERVIAWQAVHGRNDLPWQQPATPYRVWVSEVMLQQTRVETVRAYFNRFMQRFPEVTELAAADIDEVLGLWAGLGYYARARNLHRAAQQIVSEHGGELPVDPDALQALPGIGRSTSGAIQSLGQGMRQPILDGNVKRVLARHGGIAGWPGRSAVFKQLWAESESRTPTTDFARYNQGMMDLGAMVCLRQPRCSECPVADDCVARRDGTTDRIPAARPKRDIPEREVCMLVLEEPESGAILLECRPPSGIWGGLWSLPEFTSEAELIDWLGTHQSRQAQAERLPVIRHAFTHFRLAIHPFRAEARSASVIADAAGQAWHTPERIPGGLPAPVERLLNGLDAATRERV